MSAGGNVHQWEREEGDGGSTLGTLAEVLFGNDRCARCGCKRRKLEGGHFRYELGQWILENAPRCESVGEKAVLP
jgi:hypothetical protein